MARAGNPDTWAENGFFECVPNLASSIAHEINNPLQAVTNLLYLLDRTPLNPEQQGYLDTARGELARVSEIAAQTLTFNLTSGGKHPFLRYWIPSWFFTRADSRDPGSL